MLDGGNGDLSSDDVRFMRWVFSKYYLWLQLPGTLTSSLLSMCDSRHR